MSSLQQTVLKMFPTKIQFRGLHIFNCFLIYLFCLVEKVRQFALVTHIDEIGVPNDNMKNASELPCTTSICQKVGTIFDLDEYHVIPMSSYFSEKGPNIAKNIMALSALWRVCQSGRSYIREELGKEPDLEGFFD